jgi:hypothetical protein
MRKKNVSVPLHHRRRDGPRRGRCVRSVCLLFTFHFTFTYQCRRRRRRGRCHASFEQLDEQTYVNAHPYESKQSFGRQVWICFCSFNTPISVSLSLSAARYFHDDRTWPKRTISPTAEQKKTTTTRLLRSIHHDVTVTIGENTHTHRETKVLMERNQFVRLHTTIDFKGLRRVSLL